MSKLARVVAVCALAMVALPAVAASALEKLTLVTATGAHPLSVEVMRTDADREKGLMFRKTMADDHGMLFDFETVAPVMMWMKNTILPLDMVFIGADGRVVSTKQNAVPMSEAIIHSGGPVLGVLEVNAGTVAKLHVEPGDKVEHAIFAH